MLWSHKISELIAAEWKTGAQAHAFEENSDTKAAIWTEDRLPWIPAVSSLPEFRRDRYEA
jgi:hypothetical protein